jgi:hypothetical protein
MRRPGLANTLRDNAFRDAAVGPMDGGAGLARDH